MSWLCTYCLFVWMPGAPIKCRIESLIFMDWKTCWDFKNLPDLSWKEFEIIHNFNISYSVSDSTMPAIPPHCPLCPNLFCSHYPLSDIASLAAHFKFCHGLRNSSLILAKNMCFSPFAYYEVLEVLKDFRDLNDQLSDTRHFLHYKLMKENVDRRDSFKVDHEVTEAEGDFKIKRNQEVQTEDDTFLHLIEEVEEITTYWTSSSQIQIL